MLTLIAAAAVAAAHPAPAPAARMGQHPGMMQMDMAGEHGAMQKGMDCCKHCCDDMAKGHEGHGAERGGHSEQ